MVACTHTHEDEADPIVSLTVNLSSDRGRYLLVFQQCPDLEDETVQRIAQVMCNGLSDIARGVVPQEDS